MSFLKSKAKQYGNERLAAVTPDLNNQRAYAQYGFESGKNDLTHALDLLGVSEDFYKSFLTGDFDTIMKNINSDEITKGFDAQNQAISENAPRGGNRAANFALNETDKQAELNKIVTGIRSSAPQNLTNIAQILSAIAQGKLQLTGNTANVIGTLLNLEQFKQGDRDRAAANLAAYMRAAGGAAGAIAGGA